MKRIRWTEDRLLLDNTLVRAGEEMEMGDTEADGFVTNGVAEHVTAGKGTSNLEPRTSNDKKEVNGNG